MRQCSSQVKKLAILKPTGHALAGQPIAHLQPLLPAVRPDLDQHHALLVGLLFFTVWIVGLNTEKRKCYDIYFSQGVGGLNRGSNVSFAGVPVGQITKISLLPDRPEFVWVQIEVDAQTPVLQGTTAQIRRSTSRPFSSRPARAYA